MSASRPHTLPPQAHLAAHLTPYLAHAQGHLNARLQTVASKNAQLAETVRAQRDEMERLLALLEAVVRDVDGAAGVLAVDDEVPGDAGAGAGTRTAHATATATAPATAPAAQTAPSGVPRDEVVAMDLGV